MKSKTRSSVPTNVKLTAITAIALAMIFSLFPQTIPNYPIGTAAASPTIGSGECVQTVSSATDISVTQTGADCIVTFRNGTPVDWTAPTGITSIQLLVVGGGGGGGGGSRGTQDGARGAGGGGAGGRVYFNTAVPLTASGPFAISIGAGGAGGLANNNSGGFGAAGVAGSASSISGTGIATITAAGGSAGGAQTGAGASDGGGDGGSTSSIVNNVTTNRSGGSNSYEGAGGGAGAGANGANGTDIGGRGGSGGSGGAGLSANITGSSVAYAGGGGGGGTAGDSLNGSAGSGGSGGGGRGGIYQTLPAAGSANTGGGGGGGGGWRDSTNIARDGAAGGSGLIIIRYTAKCDPNSTSIHKDNLVLYLDAASSCSTGVNGLWRDLSGNGRDLTWANAPTRQTADPQFYDFVRSSSHHGTFASEGLSDFTTGFSISFFAKFDANASWERIIDFGNGQNSNNIVLSRQGDSTRLIFQIINGSSVVTRFESPDQMIVDGQWAHYAVTVAPSGDNPVKMYRNGQLQTTVQRTLASGTSYLPANVTRDRNYVARSNWADPYFDGGIGSLAIYKDALSDSEVVANYKVQARSVGVASELLEGGNKYFVTTFTSVGANRFVVPEGVTSVEVLILGGGGGAGFGYCGGGGGAGALLTSGAISVNPNEAIDVFVGAGGLGGWQTNTDFWLPGTQGGESSVSLPASSGDLTRTAVTYTAKGGGGGGGGSAARSRNFDGGTGGSGGGGTKCGTQGAAGAVDTDATPAGFTKSVNLGVAGAASTGGGGGGGGAGSAGSNSAGGAAVTRWGAVLAGGGGGWGSGLGGADGATRVGGSSTGTYNLISPANSGSPGVFGTGSGGGGGNHGGSGRVAIRYGNPCGQTGSNITSTSEQIGNECLVSITASTGTATWSIPPAVGSFSILAVGGGGGGGFDAGAGGGGGAVYVGTVVPGTNRTAKITIGAGGNPSRHSNGSTGSAGGDSIFELEDGANTYKITSPGGKLGGNSNGTSGGLAGAGGAAPTLLDTSSMISGTTNTALTTAGGAGGAGVPFNSTTAARAGTGGKTLSNSDPFPGSYGGGGGGGATQYDATTPGRPGGVGANGGGNGSGGYDSTAGRVTAFAVAGSANTGGGGGGGSAYGTSILYSINGENWHSRDAKGGGTGIIKIRYSLVPIISLTNSAITVGANDDVVSYDVINLGGSVAVVGELPKYEISPALPAGFTLDANTGKISGKSTGAATFAATSFTLTARNSFDTDTATFTLAVVSGSKPVAPVISNVAPGDAQLVVSFTQPAGTDVAAITGYRYSTNNGTSYTFVATSSAQLDRTQSPYILRIPNLTNLSSYQVNIIAVNAIGDSLVSNTVTATPYQACPTRTTNTATHVIVEITSTVLCSWTIPSAITAEMLVVGGGGGGGQGWGGGGGGGGVLHSPAQPLERGDSILVKVGTGGAGGTTTAATSKGTNGEDSYVNFLVSSARTTHAAKGGGGGGGYGWGAGIAVGTGATGGSAGGHGEIPSGTTLGRVNGTQLSIGTFVGYANAGGSMYGGGSQAGSGGGGAGGVGGNALSYRAPGVGGAGRLFDLVSDPGVHYAGGGGGGSVTGAAGGIGGGGRGSNTNSTATAGTNGLGGGGGGSSNGAGANGGSGIVIIKYSNNATDAIFDPENGETPTTIKKNSFDASPFTPIRLGYTFAGWFDVKDSAKTEDVPGERYFTTAKPTFEPQVGAATLYARWTRNVCAVDETTFVGNGTNGGTSGVNYRVFRFTTPGDCIWTKPEGLTSLNVLAVGGGGGGGSAFDTGGGGGGAGGQIKQQTLNVSSVTELVIVVGAGGTAGRSVRTPSVSETAGGNGLASELYSNGVRIVTAVGGDGGSASRADYFIAAGLSGRNVGVGGAAATTTIQARGGANGGNAASATSGRGGGGGGAAGNGFGGSATFTSGGPGGAGLPSAITGTSTTYGSGGAGGRGQGTSANNANGSAGAANLGNGGGGASAGPSSSFNGGAGGSGIVILRTESVGERFTITYNTTGGTALSAGSFVAGGTISQPANPVRAGYSLSGWSLTDGGDALTFPYTPTANQNTTLFALWSANQVSVIFNANDGTTTTKLQNLVAGTAEDLEANTFERVGFTFAGWSTNANGTGTQYTDSQSVTLLSPTELFAKWTAKELTVTFDKNDGSDTADIVQTHLVQGATPAVLITAGAVVTLRAYSGLTTFVRPGYVFSGWTNSAGEKVGDGAQVRIFTNTKYFANWTPIEFTITYNLNCGATIAANCVDNRPVDERAAFTKPAGGTFVVAQAPTRTGYEFAGWSDGTVIVDQQGNPISSRLYQPGDTFAAITGDITLIAQWEQPGNLVSFDKNGGTGDLAISSKTVLNGESMVLPGSGTVVRAGYSFGGWSTVAAGTAPQLPNTLLSPTEDVVLFAVWTANTYTITYNSNGAAGSPSAATSTYQTDPTTGATLATVGTLTKSGHTFAGWSESPTGSVVSTPYKPTSNVTLYAVWTPNTYTITYNFNGGSLVAVPTKFAVAIEGDIKTITITTAAAHNYAVGDRVTISNVVSIAMSKSVANGTYTITGITATTFEYLDSAATTPILETSVDLPDASVSVIQKVIQVSEYEVNADKLVTITTSANHELAVNDSVTITGIGAGVTNGTYTISAVTENTFSFTDANATANTAKTTTAVNALVIGPRKIRVSAAFGANHSLTAILPTKANNVLAGWTDGTSQYPVVGNYRLGAGNVVLTAIWVPALKVRYVLDGGTDGAAYAEASIPIDTSTEYELAAAPSRSGYSFAGWSTDTYAAGVKTTELRAAGYKVTITRGEGNAPTPDRIIATATWTKNPYTVIYNLNSGSGALPTETNKNVFDTFTLASSSGITRPGYRFTGWSDGALTYGAGALYSVGSENVTITAQWAEITYQISYDMNGSLTSAPASAPKTFAEGYTVSSLVPERTGFTFAGWSDGVNLYLASGSLVLLFGATESIVLTATWNQIPNSITYSLGVDEQNNAIAGTAPTQASRPLGENIILAAAPTASNRNFLGWKIGTEIYLPGQSFTIAASSTTITAQWSAPAYLVTYDLNGGSGTAPIQSPVTSGGSFTVKSNLSGSTPLFTRTNHDFKGWLIGTDAKAIGASITNVTANVVVTADWDPVLPVEFNSNGGSAVTTPSIIYRGGAGIAKPIDPTRTDFVFGGWSDGNNIVTTWPYVPVVPVTLTAVWTQLSLFGIDPNKLVRLGTLIAGDQTVSFTGSNPTNSVYVEVPAGSLPAGTKVNIDVVSEIVRAKDIISNEVDFLVSLVVHWLATDGTVPKTDPDKPVLVTIYNPAIKTGMVLYKIIGTNFTVLGRASKDGEVTFEIYEDPEILVAATRPDAPVEVTGIAKSTSSIEVSWIAPILDGGASITSYKVVSSSGQTCTTSTLSCTISGLSQNRSYSFIVIATNSVGDSIESITSADVKPTAQTFVPIEASANPSGPVVIPPPIRQTPETPVLVTVDGRSVATPPGEGSRIVDGQIVTNIIRTVNNNTVRSEFDGVIIEVKGLDRLEQNINLGANNNQLTFEQVGKVALTVSGFKEGSTALVWLLSNPLLLGKVTVKPDGSFILSSIIPKAFPLGQHTLQINGVSASNKLITQTFGVLIVEKVAVTKADPVATKLALSLSMLPRQLTPTVKQVAKASALAGSLPAKSVITCNSYVAAALPTAAQLSQAARIANLLCAPFKENKTLTTKFTKKAPINAATLKWAKRKPIRVEIRIKSASGG